MRVFRSEDLNYLYFIFYVLALVSIITTRVNQNTTVVFEIEGGALTKDRLAHEIVARRFPNVHLCVCI